MTEDYKKNLIDYITNNLISTSPTTEEIIEETNNYDRSKWNAFLPEHWTDFHFEEILKIQNSDQYIIYGGYRGVNSTEINVDVYGVIILLDNNLNPIKAFYEYDSGTKLRYIQKLRQNDDGTFYMIDDTNYAYQYNDTILNSTKRFVMLNNFTIDITGEYKLILRTSYTFPNQFNIFKCENILKNPNEAQYVMVGKGYADWANTYVDVMSIELKIPYGESPTWDRKYIVQNVNNSTDRITGRYISSYIEFDNDKYLVKSICQYTHRYVQQQQSDMYIRYYYKNYNSDTYLNTNIMNDIYGVENYDELENQALFINNNICYFILSNMAGYTHDSYFIKLVKYDTSNNTYTMVYENDYGSDAYLYQEELFLSLNQGNLYVLQTKKTTNSLADYYIQRYIDTWNPIKVAENQQFHNQQTNLFVSNEFNLVKFFIYRVNPRRATWFLSISKEIYNANQYNGEPYVDNNVLSPLYSNLYSNGSLIFSRNLYNISKQNNMTMASVEIPNTYLNETSITRNDLISETNLQMINDNKQWIKNIYEVVDLSFLNTISVIDEDNDIEYLASAIKINNAITDGTSTDYQNTPCTKYRINYTDNTTSVSSLIWTSIDDLHKETTITIYVDKAISSIDLISADETTIYLTIPLQVIVGKTYSITQKVRIGG